MNQQTNDREAAEIADTVSKSEFIAELEAKYKFPKPPKLEELRNRPVTLEELQAAFVHLADLYNEQVKVMDAAINRKQDREWRATM